MIAQAPNIHQNLRIKQSLVGSSESELCPSVLPQRAKNKRVHPDAVQMFPASMAGVKAKLSDRSMF